MQYSQEHLKTMVYAEFGEQTECIMGNWKIENWGCRLLVYFASDWLIPGAYYPTPITPYHLISRNFDLT